MASSYNSSRSSNNSSNSSSGSITDVRNLTRNSIVVINNRTSCPNRICHVPIIGRQGPQGPQGLSIVGAQGTNGIGVQGPQGPSIVGAQGAQGFAGATTFNGDSGTATGTTINIVGQPLPTTGIITSGSGNTIHIDNQRYPSQYVVDSTPGAVTQYTTVQAAYTQAVADGMGGVSGIPAVIFIRSGTYSFTTPFPITTGGISFQAVSTVGGSESIVFTSSAPGNGFAINVPDGQQPTQFAGIMFGALNDFTNTFTITNTGQATVRFFSCSSNNAAFTYRALGTLGGTTIIDDCSFSVGYDIATPLIDTNAATTSHLFTITTSIFTQSSSGTPLAIAMVRLNGSCTLIMQYCRINTVDYSSTFSTGDISAVSVVVAIFNSSFSAQADVADTTFLAATESSAFQINNSSVNGYGHMLVLTNVPSAVTTNPFTIYNSNVSTSSETIMTNTATVGAFNANIVNTVIQVLSNIGTNVNIINLSAGSIGAVNFALINNTFTFFMTASTTSYAIWGGPIANATIFKSGTAILNGTNVSTNFTTVTLTVI